MIHSLLDIHTFQLQVFGDGFLIIYLATG